MTEISILLRDKFEGILLLLITLANFALGQFHLFGIEFLELDGTEDMTDDIQASPLFVI